MLFAEFPQITYDERVMRDLSTALIIRPEIRNNKDLFFWYQLENGETPESVAFDFYGSTQLHFVIMLMNDIVDPFFDWPLETHELIALCEERYGVPTTTNGQYNTDGYYAVRHWVYDDIEYQTGFQPVGSAAVSYYEYEEALNDAKRRIKILYPEYVGKIKKEMDYLLNG